MDMLAGLLVMTAKNTNVPGKSESHENLVKGAF
jgi:hypothetical protein